MSKLAITISTKGIQLISFYGETEESRKLAFELFKSLENELQNIDSLIKDKFAKKYKEEDRSGSH